MQREKQCGPACGGSGLGWHSVTQAVIEAALLWRFAGRDDALAYVKQCIHRLDMNSEDLHDIVPGGRPPVWSYGQVALAADICRDQLGHDARDLMCRLIVERILPFEDFATSLRGYSAGRNIPLCRNINTAIAALTWGAEAGYDNWETFVDKGRDVCIQYLSHGCDHKGFSFEGTGYGQDVLDVIYLYAQLLYQSDREDLFQSEPILRRAADATLALLFPDRSSLVNIGDVGTNSPPAMPWMLIAASHYSDPTYKWLWKVYHRAAKRREQRGYWWKTFLYLDPDIPAHPPQKHDRPTTIHSPGTGTAVFRTSWRKDAVFTNFLASGRSHTAAGHSHADSGHFSIFAHGEYLAIDTGRYNANEDQHSVVLIDGENTRDIPEGTWGSDMYAGRFKDYQHHHWLDYALVDMSHQKNCIWADRHLFFVRHGDDNAYIVVLDNINKDNQSHDYEWLLQAHPEAQIKLNNDREARIRKGDACLDITFIIPSPDDFPQNPHTLSLRTDEKWWTWPYGLDADVSDRSSDDLGQTSLVRPRLVGEHSGPNCTILTVISPRGVDQQPLEIQPTPHKRTLHVEVTSSAGTDTILCAPDHGYINVPGFCGFSELAVVRSTDSSKTVATWTNNGQPMRTE